MDGAEHRPGGRLKGVNLEALRFRYPAQGRLPRMHDATTTTSAGKDPATDYLGALGIDSRGNS